MKKIFLSSIVLMFAAVASAATYTWENVVTLKLTDGNSDTYTSRFGEAPELTDEASWGAAVANLEGATVRAYTVLDGVNYEKLYLQDMENTALVVKTHESTSLSFELKANYGTITLYDKLTGDTKTVDKAGVAGLETDTYNCTVETNATIEGRFFLFYNVAHFYKVTTNALGWATFSYDVDLAPADDQILYKGSINGDVLTLNEVADVKAGQGVLVKGTANTTYYFNAATSTADFAGNDLKATATYTTSMENVYVLKGDAFLEYIGTDALKANKAFIQLGAGAGAPKRIRMVVNHATGVENVQGDNVQCTKVLENGQVLIRRGNEVYNLQGQKLR